MNFAHFVPINLQSVHSILCLNDLGNVSWPTYHTPVLPLFLLWKESSCCTIRSLQFPFMILVCPRSLQYHRKIIVLSFISTVWCSVPHPIPSKHQGAASIRIIIWFFSSPAARSSLSSALSLSFIESVLPLLELVGSQLTHLR